MLSYTREEILACRPGALSSAEPDPRLSACEILCSRLAKCTTKKIEDESKLLLANVQSLKSKGEVVMELLWSNKPDLLCMTESWLTPANADSFIASRVSDLPLCESFEFLNLSMAYRPRRVRVLVVYRPPASSMTVFMTEFQTVLETISALPDEVIIADDFNIHVDVSTDKSATDLSVATSTHSKKKRVTDQGHILDLVLTRQPGDFIRHVSVGDFISDYRLVTCSLRARSPGWPTSTVKIRPLKSIDADAFSADIRELPLLTDFYRDKVAELRGDPRRLHQLIDGSLDNKSSPAMPSFSDSKRLCAEFSNFYATKVSNIRTTIDSAVGLQPESGPPSTPSSRYQSFRRSSSCASLSTAARCRPLLAWRVSMGAPTKPTAHRLFTASSDGRVLQDFTSLFPEDVIRLVKISPASSAAFSFKRSSVRARETSVRARETLATPTHSHHHSPGSNRSNRRGSSLGRQNCNRRRRRQEASQNGFSSQADATAALSTWASAADKWFTTNRVKCNIEKTVVMYATPDEQKLERNNLQVGASSLPPSAECRHLALALALEMPLARRARYGDRAFSVAGPKIWNSLPDIVKCSSCLGDFKSRLKTYLFSRVYSSTTCQITVNDFFCCLTVHPVLRFISSGATLDLIGKCA
ncbi:hypothetical protein DAPPUDRAFT_117271 [Daphnia pulex]|uniref:Endonuclease/exonuclease/phosphatase domain-containing protein n=1 Tax=Daphnia pulex TaxID=6669 RepID=E9HS37_DAPPU|nr:hypothetical protein DAPPUDRAFT_117271 [Daphnia pulex]|eukprot:EFX65455.1 hypothetical protein DAPPUDRAFT_117271 [Daphnia pulex]